MDAIYRFPATPEIYRQVMASHSLAVKRKFNENQHEVYEVLVNKNKKPVFLSWLYVAAAPDFAKDFFAQCLVDFNLEDGIAGEDNNLISICKVCEDGFLRTVSIIHNTVLFTICIPETEEFMWSIIYELGYLPEHSPLIDATFPQEERKKRTSDESGDKKEEKNGENDQDR